MECRICENKLGNKVYIAKEMMYGYKDEYTYFQCSNCTCLQIKEYPKEMSKFYDSSTYYSYQSKSKSQRLRSFLLSWRDKYAMFGAGFIGRILNEKYPTDIFSFLAPIKETLNVNSKILDVGCGSGKLLVSLKSAGFKNLIGADPFIDSDLYLDNGITIKKQSIHEVTGSFELIMFHHSFEHVSDPLETMQSAFNLLKPGACCIIRIPTVSSFAWEHYGVNWFQLDAPRHFYLHSIQSMELLAKSVGFDMRDPVYDSTVNQFWGSEQYLKGIALRDDNSYLINPLKSIFSKEDIDLYTKRAEKLNVEGRGDQAIFYLMKPI